MNKYNFLSGLPRAGSTLLASLLNQHPKIHASATSALLDLLVSQANAVQMNRTFYEITESQEVTVYNGMFDSYYKHIDKDVIIDKHRAWPNLIAPLRKMGIEAKVICTNRPIPDVITSYITLIDKNPDTPNFIDELITKRNLPINIHNRAMTIWTDYVQIPHTVLTNAIKENPKNLLFVNYDDLVKFPHTELARVCDFIGLPDNLPQYNFDNIINNRQEKDESGWKLKGLHDIRPKLEKVSKSPDDVIGKDLTNYFSQFNLVIN